MSAANGLDRQRARRGVATVATLLMLACAVPAAAQAQRVVDVDPTAGISALGEAIEISGSGYSPIDHPNGFYVAQAAVVDDGGTDVVRYGNAKLVRPNADPASPNQIELEDDGTFAGQLNVTGSFTQGANPTINCAVTQCSVVSWLARTQPTPGTLFTTTDIDFVPAIAATPYSTLDRAGQEVDVDGAGYNPAAPGIYLAQTAIVGGQVRFGAARWLLASGPTPDVTLNPDGTFDTTLELAMTFTSNGDTVDCSVVQCSVSTWTAHTNPLPPGGTPGPGQSPISAANDVFFEIPIEVTPVTPPDTGESLVTVSGRVPVASRFPGIYVSFGQWAYPFWAVQDAFADTVFVPGSLIDATDGTFETTVPVSPTFTPAAGGPTDCRLVQCGIFTMRAHGFSQTDRSFDSFTPLTFVTPEPQPQPDPKTEPKPEPKPEPKAAATFTAFTKAQRLSRKRTARVGRVVCAAPTSCSLTAPRRVNVKIGKRWYSASVLAPKRIGAGRRAPVRIKLTKRAARALAKRGSGVARVRVRVSSDGSGTSSRRLVVKLASGR